MIDCKELKIGNIIWENYGGQKIVTAINCNNVGAYPDSVMGKAINGNVSGLFHCSEIYPIPLDAELLEKCGFERKNKNPRQDHYEIKTPLGKKVIFYLPYTINAVQGRFSLWHHSMWGGLRIEIKSLHHLQNSFYFLTGEELNYQP